MIICKYSTSKMKAGGWRGGSAVKEHLLLLQITGVQSPAPVWWPTTASNSSSRVSSALRPSQTSVKGDFEDTLDTTCLVNSEETSVIAFGSEGQATRALTHRMLGLLPSYSSDQLLAFLTQSLVNLLIHCISIIV